MSWQTNRLLIVVRRLGPYLGINAKVARHFFGRDYEGKYDAALSEFIQEGSCIWDVGANRGHYTRAFADAVGPEGLVYAFEPSPSNFTALVNQCQTQSNIKCLQLGLGAENGESSFEQTAGLGTTSRVIESSKNATDTVQIRTGEATLQEFGVQTPTVLKIDVEGLELDVLHGCLGIISSADLIAIGVEIHFRLLEARGQADAPRQIETLLAGHGFAVTWPDPSHIVAHRQHVNA